MNYSHSKQICEIIRGFLVDGPVDTAMLKSRLSSEVEERRSVASAQQLTKRTWNASHSEWEFISVLQGLADLLNESDEKVEKGFLSIMDAVMRDTAPLRVVFFVQEYSLWASFRTVYEYFKTMDNCIVDLVYVYTKGTVSGKEKAKGIRDFRDDGYRIIDMEDYDLSAASPDIAFYLKPYKESNGAPIKFYIQEVSKHIKYTVFISYCLDVQGGSRLVKFFYTMPMYFYAWKVIAYSSYYADMLKRHSYRDGDNIVEFGHPKFDGVNQIMQKDTFRKSEWDMFIGGRSVVMWNSHFTIKDGEGVGTFFAHKDTIFDYFKCHKDVVLLWRPHPFFWQAVEADSRCGEKGLKALLCELDEMGNVIVDRGGDYRYAFAYSDALVSDAATFLVEFAITGRPVMYTPKPDGETVINDQYLAGMEICDSEAGLSRFIENVCSNDSERDAQKAFFEHEFGVCDGRNGERIGSYIYDAVNKDCMDYALDLLGLRGEE